nr:hypothetical protein [Evansella caseinilytica]
MKTAAKTQGKQYNPLSLFPATCQDMPEMKRTKKKADRGNGSAFYSILIEDVQKVRDTASANLNARLVSPLLTYVPCTLRCSNLPRFDLLAAVMSSFLKHLFKYSTV